MRLPITPQLSTKDGVSNKNARLTNVLKEARPTGNDMAVIRPALKQIREFTGEQGKGLVTFNDQLISVYGSTLRDEPLYFSTYDCSKILSLTSITSNAQSVSAGGDLIVGYSYGATYIGPSGFFTIGAIWDGSGQILTEVPPTYGSSLTFSDVHGTDLSDCVVVGRTRNAQMNRVAIKWTQSGGVEYLPLLDSPPYSDAYATCATTIVGYSAVNDPSIGWYFDRACKWDMAGNVTDLTSSFASTEFESYAYDVSDDGTKIVGYIEDSQEILGHRWLGFYWDNGELTYVSNPFPSDENDISFDVISGDGKWVFGSIRINNEILTGFRWSKQTGIEVLPIHTQIPGANNIYFYDASGDGNFAVGSLQTPNNILAFVWSSTTGAFLIDYNLIYSVANGITSDGTFVVGTTSKTPSYSFSASYWQFNASEISQAVTGSFFDFTQSPL